MGKAYFKRSDRDGEGQMRRLAFLHGLGFDRAYAFYQKVGGRGGIVDVETVDYEQYLLGRDGIDVYVVIDDTTQGYAHLMSVIIEMSENTETAARLRAFLEKAGFATENVLLPDRPPGPKSFRSYIVDGPIIFSTGAFRAP